VFEVNLGIWAKRLIKPDKPMMTFINASKIGSKQFLVLAFFLLTVCAHGAPPGYTLVYTNNFNGHTNVSNTSWGGSNFSSLNAAGEGFTTALGYWEVVLTTNNWGYWPDIWLSGSVDKHRTSSAAELGVLEAGPMTGIGQHVKVLSPAGQELVSLLHTRPGGVSQGTHVFGCLIKADLITFSIDNQLMWTAPTPPEASKPLFVYCNFVVATTPPDPGANTAAIVRCYVPSSSSPSPTP
jgi:hypothetical protein